MKRRNFIILALLLSFTVSLFMTGKVLAGPYTRYVISVPSSGNIYLFTKSSGSGLQWVLKMILGLFVPQGQSSQTGTNPTSSQPVPSSGQSSGQSGSGSQPVSQQPGQAPDQNHGQKSSSGSGQEAQPSPAPQSGSQSQEPGQPSSGLTADEKTMLDLVNQERAKVGLKPLTVNMTLVELARKKSQDMIDKNYFSHISPTYGSPFDMMKNAGITYKIAGENLAGAPTVLEAHQALMNSEGHRRNILNPEFTEIGIGIAKGGPYGMMFTQMFIGN